MIFVNYDKTNGKVTFVHYLPFDESLGLGKTKEQLEQEGLLVDSIPEPIEQVGKAPILYVNTFTKELYYEYEDIILPVDETQQKLEQLEQENADILFSNALQKSRISGLEEENASIIFELAAIKGGI